MTSIYIFNGIIWPVFLIALLIHLYSRRKEVSGVKDNIFQIVSKNVLVPILIIAVSINIYVLIPNVNKNIRAQYAYLAIIGLFLGWIGDILLINWKKEESETLTLAGLGSFLFGHIFVMVFIGLTIQDSVGIHKSLFWIMLAPLIILPAVIWQVRMIKNSDLFMKIIICIYAITLMMLIGLSITDVVASHGIWKISVPIMLGSVLFAVSDSILGLTLFRKFKIHTGWVMTTYGLAQAFLSASFIALCVVAVTF